MQMVQMPHAIVSRNGIRRAAVMPAVRAVRPANASGRSGYTLTAKGRSLLPVLSSIADWGLAHIPGTEARMRPNIGR